MRTCSPFWIGNPTVTVFSPGSMAFWPLPDIEIRMVGHHGSKHSSSEELLEAVRPEVGIISVGENNYGHPSCEAMDRMAFAEMTLYRTDLQGNILLQVGQ